MPKILISKNIVFAVFPVDNFADRLHIHTYKTSPHQFECAKFWLEPTVRVTKQGDFGKQEILELEEIIRKCEDKIKEQLKRFYAGEEVITINLNI